MSTVPAPAPVAANPALARALETIRTLRAQLEQRAEDRDLAVVGVGLRLPGGIDSLDSYWTALADGRDLVGPLPAGRKGPFGAEWAKAPQRGGFLDEVMEFDAGYFGISPREAAALDPQHRLVLEVAVEALEHAALPPDRLDGQRVGLYLGISGMEYREWMDGEPDTHWATGTGHCFAAGRVSYSLGLSGPAIAVDTACSSSLVAVHLARRALAAGECDVALAGGVNIVLSARSMQLLASTGSLAPDGRCKPFDARANGFARGEGCGLVVLKRLSDARRAGDRVLGVIRGSALNHDGHSTGFTAPNVLSQVALAEATLADASLKPSDIGLVETHGTGTSLGDPIEMDALITAFGRRNGGARLPIGAVKANMGHLESAAGIAGLIKLLLCLEHRAVPPLVNFRTLNPRIDLTGTGIVVPTELEPWPAAATGQYAIVSSFGMSGTNAQVILGPAEPANTNATGDAHTAVSGTVSGFELAAKSPEALRALAARFATRLAELDEHRYPAFAYTATHGRTRHRFRAQVTAANQAAALDALRALAERRPSSAVNLHERDRSADAEPMPRDVIDLPHYPWERRRHPAADTTGTAASAAKAAPPQLYTLAWEPTEIAAPTDHAAPVTVIAGDDEELINLIKAQARVTGTTVVEPEFEGDDELDWAQFWSTRPPSENATLLLAPRATRLPETLEDDSNATAVGALLCARVTAAVAQAAANGSRRVSVLTRGARQATGHDKVLASDHGLLHGLAPVLGLEFPGAWGAIIDLPPEPTAADAATALRLASRSSVPNDSLQPASNGHGPNGALRPTSNSASPNSVGRPADETHADSVNARDLNAHDLIAIRDGATLAAVLVPADPVSTETPLRQDATYLVTGALGAVGRAITASLAERGARHLLLLGRRAESQLDAAGADLLRTLRADGVEAVYRAADCADPAALAAACTALAELPPVRGIVHAAGALGRVPLAEARAADFAEAAGAKFGGGWWLHLLARDWPLDFFVATSSVSALWGTAGYGPYAAANGGLDLIAAHRTAVGVPATSIAFGPWAVDGMAASDQRERLAHLGLAALTADEGCAAVAAHAPGSAGYCAAFDADWSKFAPAMAALRVRRLFDRVAADNFALSQHTDTSTVAGHSVGQSVSQYADTSAFTGRSPARSVPEPAVDVSGLGVPDAVAAITASVLGHTDPTQVNRDTGFHDLGLDSVMAIDLAKELTTAFGRPVTVTDLFDHPTVTTLARHLTTPASQAVAETVHIAETAHASEAVGRPPVRDADAANEPIAIVGLAGRFPGADSAEEFWELLRRGDDAVGPVPAGRWDGATHRQVGSPRRGSDTATGGGLLGNSDFFGDNGLLGDAGFLGDVARFDAGFFGMSAREARSLDPQHRLILETSWHALEDAGVDPRSLKNTRTGVFVGISNADYARVLEEGGIEAVDAHFATGNALNAAAGRLAFLLGLRGPAMAVDTACSSSLVALHLAVRSLRAGETDCAIVGGVNVLASPTTSVAVGRAHMLSPTGRCRTFSADADGFVRAEGCGVVVLKRLADARGNRDRVWATVLGTAVNQDGASSALTAPNGLAQSDVIAEALRDAGTSGSAISYLEAHGTGTVLGDPVEIEAAYRVLGPRRPPGEPLLLGSVKSNIGHCESAAGIAGVIKTVLALRHETLPPGLHCAQLNPHIPWPELNVRVVDAPTAWPASPLPRLAGVSAFGFSGTNAHVVLGEPPQPDVWDPRAVPVAGPFLLPLSATDPAGLERVTHAWSARLEDVLDRSGITMAPDVEPVPVAAEMAALARTASVGRAHLPSRRAALGRDAAELLTALRGPAPASTPPGRTVADGRPPRVLFLFPGQGSQYFGMGRELYATEPVFRGVIDACAAAVGSRLGAPLTDLMFAGTDTAAIDRTDVTQPALVALELALARLWASWGVTPTAVLGHSVGEIPAAVLAGLLDESAAMDLAVQRGRLMQSTEPGAMLAVSARPTQVVEWIEGRELDLAADNGPVSATVAGRAEAVEEFAAWLAERSVRTRRLAVSRAFHSRLMDPILDELRAALSGHLVSKLAPALPLLANLTGDVAGPGTHDADYWAQHVRNPVLFGAAAARIPQLDIDICLEVGPGRALGGLIASADVTPGRGVFASLPVPGRDRAGLLAAAKGLYEGGQDLIWDAIQRATGADTRAPAPRYPFAGAAHWPTANAATRSVRRLGAAGPHWGHELHSPALSARVFEFERSESFPAHLTDHRLYGTVVTPGASHVATILSALAGDGRPFAIDDLVFHRAQVIGHDESHATQLVLHGSAISMHSRIEPSGWVTHLTARTGPAPAPAHFAVPDRAAFIAQAEHHLPAADFYRRSSDLGYTHGPSFRWVTDIWVRGSEAMLRYVRPPLPDNLADYEFHPGLIDSFLQGIAAFEAAAASGRAEQTDSLAVPFAAARLSFPGRPGPDDELWGYVRADETEPPSDTQTRIERADMYVADADGRVVFAAEGFRTRQAARTVLESYRRAPDTLAYELAWQERPADPGQPGAENRIDGSSDRERVHGAAVIYGAEAQLSAELSERLSALGLRARALDDGRRVPAAALVVDGRFLAPVAGSEPERARDAAVSLAATLRESPPGTQYAVLCEAGPAAAPLRESLWGLLASLESEEPERRLTRVTLDPGWSPDALVQALAGNLTAQQDRFEPRLRVGAGSVQVARLAPVPVPVPQEADPVTSAHLTDRIEGAALITGGLGALGLSLLRLLARQGIEAVTLLGRSAPSPAAQVAIDEVRASGVRVAVLTGDVSDPGTCARALAEAGRHAPLRQVFHLAGTLRDGAFASLTADDFQHVFAGKAIGASSLAAGQQGGDLRGSGDPGDAGYPDGAGDLAQLDAFVLFSSASSVLGSPGQTNYAAANGYLNGLAEQLRGRGVPAVSVAWGPWIPNSAGHADGGMAASGAAQRAGARRGVRPLTDDEAAEILALALARTRIRTQTRATAQANERAEPDLLAVAADFDQYAEQLGPHPAVKLVADLVSARARTADQATDTSGPRGWLRARLDAGDPASRPETLRDAIRTVLRDVLGEPGQIDDSLGFTNLGLDSITMIDLRTQLAQALDADLPTTMAVDHPSIAELAGFLLDSGLVDSR